MHPADSYYISCNRVAHILQEPSSSVDWVDFAIIGSLVVAAAIGPASGAIAHCFSSG